jgi:hypothetical protein
MSISLSSISSSPPNGSEISGASHPLSVFAVRFPVASRLLLAFPRDQNAALHDEINDFNDDAAGAHAFNANEAARFADLENQVKHLQQNEQDIVQAAKSTETKCSQQLHQMQQALSKTQAEAALLKNAVQKMVEQFNILVEGVQIAQGKGVFSLEVASHMHNAIATTAALFESKQEAGAQ